MLKYLCASPYMPNIVDLLRLQCLNVLQDYFK